MVSLLKRCSLLSLIATLFFMSSCSNVVEESGPCYDLSAALDSVQKVYAPDKRVKLWMSDIQKTNGACRLDLALDNKATYNIVKALIAKDFPEVDAHIELLPEKESAQLISALANNSVINLRSEPRHSAEIATQALLGTPLRILEMRDEWYLVQTPNKYIAWTDDGAIVEVDRQHLEKYKVAKKIVYDKQYGFSYSEPDTKSLVVSDLVLGCILPVKGEKGEFYRVSYPDGRNAFVLKNEFIGFEELSNKEPNMNELVETAKKFNGIPYLWGGTSSKAIDCSGFTSTVYFMSGLVLQRDASQQTKYGKEISTDYEYDKLQAGDLLFFGRPASDTLPEKVTHVALYIKDGEFIHASGKVRINSMDSTQSNYISSYPRRFVRAVRVNGNYDDFGVQRIKDNDFYKEILNKENENQ
ncbi:MAG: C40 family peptidase [Chlorobi bacterium]|nr:C40 family peptidase [Chlorobiota bacterium]